VCDVAAVCAHVCVRSYNIVWDCNWDFTKGLCFNHHILDD